MTQTEKSAVEDEGEICMKGATQQGEYAKVLLAAGSHRAMEELLSLLNWEELGFQICGTAENGRDAWTIFTRQLPDLVITDTQLPLLDGLTLVSQIRQKAPDLPVLLLTDQAEFETARRAIALNVSGYLLRSELSAANLGQWLLSMRGKLGRRSSVTRLYRRNCLESFLCGPQDPVRAEALAQELSAIPASCWGMLLVGEAQNMHPFTPWNQGDVSGSHNYLRQQICTPAVLERLRREYQCEIVAIPCQNTSVLILVCFAHSLSVRSSQHSAIRRVAEVIWDSCDDNGRRPTVLYREDVFAEVPQIYTTYLSLIQHYRYTIFGASGQMINLLALDQLAEGRAELAQPDPGRGLPEIEEDQLLAFLDRECSALSRSRSLTQLEVFLQTVGQLLDSFMQHEMCAPSDAETLRLRVGECTGIAELRETLGSFVQNVCRGEESDCSLRIRKVIQFIYQNYMLDISVQDAAARVGLNAEYLNKIFKREMGVGFSRYLTAYRMKVAKDLLSSGECRIGEVAELVGYKSSQYFSVAFRQEVGESPTAFLKRQ